MDLSVFARVREQVAGNVSRAVVGKDAVVELLLISYLCGGHVLMEDIPGVGKTTLVKAFARSVGAESRRIQFTPDLLPSDLTGIHFFNEETRRFEFRPGPLFTGIVLADEINRATPRTQSSLLEAMEERQITVDGETRKLGDGFMVLATQNPIESAGTFPLPEAQMDRFFLRTRMGYPRREEEERIIRQIRFSGGAEALGRAAAEKDLQYVRSAWKETAISEDVMQYLLDIVEAVRRHPELRLGVSPRGSIALAGAAQACAALAGRDYVIPEDLQKMAPHVLSHRILLKNARQTDAADWVRARIEALPVPVEPVP